MNPKTKNRLVSLLCWFDAIVIMLTLWAVTSHYGLFYYFAGISILWAALDSKRVRLWRYHTGISGGPATVVLSCLFLGPFIVLAWYLGMRFKIMTGTARLRQEYQPWKMSDSVMSPNGLIQPWRGRKL